MCHPQDENQEPVVLISNVTRVSAELWEWWEGRLTRLERQQLMSLGREGLPPDLAEAIATKAVTLRVVERTRTPGGEIWRLSEEAARFVGDREYERRHPDDDSARITHTVYSMPPAFPARVELLYTESCPNWESTAIRLSIALQVTGREDIDVEIRRVNTPEEAELEQFTGSPMIRLDGVDPFDEPGLAVGLTCRLYRDAEDVEGGPTVTKLVDALLARDVR